MKKVEEFIKILNETNIPVSLRQVIIPGFNDNLKYLKSLKEYIKRIKNIRDITFIPYHKLGIGKYLELDIYYPMDKIVEMDFDKCQELYQMFLKL